MITGLFCYLYASNKKFKNNQAKYTINFLFGLCAISIVLYYSALSGIGTFGINTSKLAEAFTLDNVDRQTVEAF
jgi:hypothetical protein